jgi:hypothetical protein
MEDVSTDFALGPLQRVVSLETLVHVSIFLGLLAPIAVSVIALMDAVLHSRPPFVLPLHFVPVVLFSRAVVVKLVAVVLLQAVLLQAVLLQAVLLHIVFLAVGSSPGIPRIMEIFVLALPLRLPVLVVVISIPYLICHCSLFCASAERRYCLVLWPAEGHHCSTCVPAHLRVAEGCCLSAESDLTDHLVCVCLRSFEEFRMGSMFDEVLYVRRCSRVSLMVEMEVRIEEGDLLY